MAATFIINPGSTSKKYALFRKGACVVVFYAETTSQGFTMSVIRNGVKEKEEKMTSSEFEHGVAYVLQYLRAQRDIATIDEITTIGVRVVCPGTYFTKHREINSAYITQLESQQGVAPLHIPGLLSEIAAVQKELPQTKIYAVSDSAFHTDIPSYIRTVSIPKKDAQDLDIHRFGYHGISFASIVRNYETQYGTMPQRSIVCHIGGGVSIAALKEGKSIATSMGYTPVSGVAMGSRGGDVTAGVVAALTTLKKLQGKDLYTYLYTQSGLKGVSGISDLRLLLERKASGDFDASLAIDMFVYHIRSWIGQYAVLLGGVDTIILTATAAVRNPYLRSLLLQDLEVLNVHLDVVKNEGLVGKGGYIHSTESKVKLLVMKTDEMGEMARICQSLNTKI